MNDKNLPEIWGGIECSITRVFKIYNNQLHRSSHYNRLSDLERIASLGIKTLRYPVLWESIAPYSSKMCNFRQAETSLNLLRTLGIKPVAGLLHHGSGPMYTNLLDTRFPELFARFASYTARKFPWITYYTPVNEPLTTARFSALYGHWYPHAKDNYSFCCALLNQCKAIVMAMQEIRKVNPEAKLVQTEDIGRVSSTEKLSYQAAFENERRWITYDLLCGKFNESSLLWSFFISSGIEPRELEFFSENKCEPDILGINYYITSERYLDHNYKKYPQKCFGGNDIEKYADIETVRTGCELYGIENIIKEAHNRYNKTIAITEAHLACSREEQLRWLNEIWNAAVKAKNDGADVKAVTAWALLGSFDWCSLLTENKNIYESGVFDIRSGEPRPTALAGMIKSIAENKKYVHPVLENPGWWKRPERSIFNNTNSELSSPHGKAQPLLITGATGTLGRAFARICRIRGIDYVLTSRNEMDITDYNSVKDTIKKHNPWAVVNTAGFVDVDKAEMHKAESYLSNTVGAEYLSNACLEHGLNLVTFSTDLVFNGCKGTPYIETDRVSPVNVYGMTKAAAERKILSRNPGALIIRTSAFFGPWDKYNFIYSLLSHFEKNRTLSIANDIYISPTYVPELVNETLNLLIDGEKGIWHITNEGELSWADFAFMAAETFNINNSFINPVSSSKINFTAKRPSYSVLNSNKGIKLSRLNDALSRYMAETESVSAVI